jgi:hypothetical protein
MGLLYGRAGRLTALFGGFRPGQDVARVWEVLNPEKKSWIPFAEFVAGMIKVKRDPELSAILPMDVPNRCARLHNFLCLRASLFLFKWRVV